MQAPPPPCGQSMRRRLGRLPCREPPLAAGGMLWHGCSPGGYFHAMVAKAKTGELNLARTWGLRQVAASGSRRGFSHPRSPSCT
jgi:hypothetical protein